MNVKFKNYASPYSRKYYVQRNRIKEQNRMPSSNEEDLTNNVPNHVPEKFDKFNFDFSFNKERDDFLIANRADRFCHNDAEILKYWFQRYRLFTKLDEGILMDRGNTLT